MKKLLLSTVFLLALVGVAAAAALAVESTFVRGGGVQLEVPEDWVKVERADEPPSADPRTLLVAGTRGTRPIDTECQVASYRVPADGAVVVVLGSRGGYLEKQQLELSKLRRPMFSCFGGRGAMGQVSRKGRDYQVNIMVGDDATQATIREAYAVARSFGLAPR